MKFGPVPLDEAIGGIAAHSVREGEAVVKKGTVVGPAEVAALRAAGIDRIVVARLEPGDVPEDEAARRLGAAAAGPGVRVERPFTGRSNLFAEHAGVLVVDAEAIGRVNAVDESLTVATLPAWRAVEEGEMIGTVKVIPFAVGDDLLARAVAAVGEEPPVRVAAFRPLRVGVVSTLLPGLKPSVIRKTIGVLQGRLGPAGASIVVERETPHDPAALTDALARLKDSVDLIVVFGASAITDRRDVIPAALEAAGGTIDHFGMPVDPGNLLLIGRLGGRPVLGAPGCARSPKENGFDWCCSGYWRGSRCRGPTSWPWGRRAADGDRAARAPARRPRGGGRLMRSTLNGIAAIVLAAGRSSRMGGANKLLADVGGKAMVRHAAEAALDSGASPVVVVCGHDEPAVRQALAGLDVRCVPNPDYADGLSTSLKVGVGALGRDIDGSSCSSATCRWCARPSSDASSPPSRRSRAAARPYRSTTVRGQPGGAGPGAVSRGCRPHRRRRSAPAARASPGYRDRGAGR